MDIFEEYSVSINKKEGRMQELRKDMLQFFRVFNSVLHLVIKNSASLISIPCRFELTLDV